MSNHYLEAHKTVTFVRKLSKFWANNATNIFKSLLVLIGVFLVFKLSIAIHESTEMYILRNWGTMQEFADIHREYSEAADLAAREEALLNFMGGLENK